MDQTEKNRQVTQVLIISFDFFISEAVTFNTDSVAHLDVLFSIFYTDAENEILVYNYTVTESTNLFAFDPEGDYYSMLKYYLAFHVDWKVIKWFNYLTVSLSTSNNTERSFFFNIYRCIQAYQMLIQFEAVLTCFVKHDAK